MIKINDLYDLSHTQAKGYLEGFTYPWEALAGIKEMIIGLIEEEKGWRIDTSTYLKYNDRQEEYEDLLDKKKK